MQKLADAHTYIHTYKCKRISKVGNAQKGDKWQQQQQK